MREPEVLQPDSLAALVDALQRTTRQSRCIAGGTDLMLHLHHAAQPPDILLDLSYLPELAGVREQGGRLHIGAMTRFDAIASHPAVQAHARCLAQAAGSVGSMQIRCMATLGGNVANASACADTVPALLALQADVGVLGADGVVQRRALTDVLDAARRKALAHDEVLVDFSLPLPPAGTRSAFAKLGARTAVTIAKLNAALVVEYSAAGATVTGARVAFGSLAPVARLDAEAAQTLVGQVLDDATAQQFVQACTALVDRAIPGRASQPYKRLAIQGLARDLLDALEPSPASESR